MNAPITAPIKNRRTRMVARLGVFLTLLVVVSGIAIPAAHAASYTYANALSTPEAQPRFSGLRSTVTGGTSELNSLAFGTQVIVTYYGYPGYTEVGYNATPAGYRASLHHLSFSNAHSKCYWTWNGVGGNADITCQVFS